MDDNEAEVDLAVNASLLKKISDDNEQPEAVDVVDDTEEVANAESAPEDVDGNVETVVSIEKGDEVEHSEVVGDQVEVAEEVAEDGDDDGGGPPPPPTAEEGQGMRGGTAEENEEQAEEEEIIGESEDDVATTAPEAVIGVDSVVSRDHISPTPPFTASNKIQEHVSVPTATGTIQTSPTQQTTENVNIDAGEVQGEDSERLPAGKLGKVVEITINAEEDGEETILPVRIIDATYKKPFLGGFRNKKTGIEYLNASSQTYPKKVLPKVVEVFSRDTQTVEKKSQVQQTMYDTSTQMTKPGCYVSDATDVVIIPGKYVTAAEKEKMKLEKVVILQSYWRRWLATQYVHKLRMDRAAAIEWERKEAERLAAERAERLRLEFERRMKPKSKSDFDLLYAALEGWRQEEMERINNSHSGPERKAALIALLEQEAYLIQSIERHRLNADELNYSDNVVKFLDKAAQPKFWRAYDGRKTEMNTKYSLRAQELKDIYNTLQKTYLNQDERLDILLTLKHTVKEHDCKITQEMIELIDREADLLTRNVKSSNLEGLRQRISTLFLQYCKTPEFNPDVARLLKVPKDSAALRKDIYFCPSCNSYLPSTEFPLASNSRIVGRCKKCSKLDNNARLRHDFTKIRSILQHLRRTEEAFNDGSKIAFIIQDADLRYLIEKIWNSQSALSGLEDLLDLVFVRWNKHEHWSPWNCLLLTKEEASAHMKLECITEAYGRIFVGKVHHRHVVAKQYFSKLTGISNNMQKKSLPQPLGGKKVAAQ